MANSQNPAENQFQDYKNANTDPDTLGTGAGAPIDNLRQSLTAGEHGPTLLQDLVLVDELSHFSRERIPERLVHAKAAGAFGYFECTKDVTQYTKATPFSQIGKQTKIASRFSTVGGEKGSADTVRDLRGFATKFYTEDGIWDLLAVNTDTFFIRDAILFPSFIHSQKKHPAKQFPDPSWTWDFLTLRPETTLTVMFLFSDRGIPDGYRYMNGYAVNTFKLVNDKGEAFWCRFHLLSDQGVKNLSKDDAAKKAGSDPDYSTRDLYNAIDTKNYPSWTLSIQVMTMEEGKTYKYDIFDATKAWLISDFPPKEVGKIVVNENPTNYFADVEQMAFSPGNLIPGIEPSPDKLLQGRIFVYGDTQRHRLGANHLQLPVNCPLHVSNYQRDGPQCFNNQGGGPNYFPNSFGGPQEYPSAKLSPFTVEGEASRYPPNEEQDFDQATIYWNDILKEDERARLVENIAESLKNAVDSVQKRAVDNFTKVDPKFGSMVQDALKPTK